MRYVEGPTLRHLVDDEAPLAPGRALAISAQVASALDAAHARGLVHRDVKPSNILLDDADHAYLSDFGLSRALGAPDHPGPGLSLGTPTYIAPEQIRGDTVDGRADQYALACVLYESLTGRPPFCADSEIALLFAHLEEPPPLEVGPVGQILARALSKEPDARYAACSEVVGQAAMAIATDGRRKQPRGRFAVAAAVAALLTVSIAVAALGTTGRGENATSTASATTGDGRIVEVDPGSMRVAGSVAVGRDLSGLAVDDETVWAASLGSGTVARVDARTRRVVGEISVAAAGSGPTGIALSGDHLWIVNAGQDEVSIYSIGQGRLRWDEPRHTFGSTPWNGLAGSVTSSFRRSRSAIGSGGRAGWLSRLSSESHPTTWLSREVATG